VTDSVETARIKVVYPAFVVRSSSDAARTVVDDSYHNGYTAQRACRCETLADLAQVLRPEDAMLVWDVADAYHHLLLRTGDARYLAFELDGRVFIPLTMHFGFAQDWSVDNCWENSPFNLIGPLVRRIVTTGACVTLVAPHWEAQPWWGTAMEECTTFLPLPLEEGVYTRGAADPHSRRPWWRTVVFRFDGRAASQRDKDVSKPWVTRWVRRHRQQLSLRTFKALADKRAGPEVLKGIKAFYGELETLLEFHSFTPASVFNYDETRVTQTDGMLVVKRMEARGKARSNASTTCKETAASLLTFVLASGDVFKSVYVIKAKFGDSDAVPVDFCLHKAPRSSRRCWPRFYGWSKTGYLDGELFGAVMDNFVSEWEVCNPGVPAILFSDQLGVHRQPDVVERALEKAVYLWYLPKNTSHVTQPLDEAPVANFKSIVAAGAEQGAIDGMLSNEGTRNELLHAAFTAEARAFLRASIAGAFRRCGLWLFVPEPMIAQVADALGMGHSDQSTRGLAAAAAADVIQEASSRSKAAKNRSSTGSAVVQRSVLHAPDALLEQSRDNAANKASEDAVKAAKVVIRAHKKLKRVEDAEAAAAARIANLCKVCRGRTRRGGKGWTGSHCGSFWVCPACINTVESTSVMEGHLEECPGTDSDECSSEGKVE